MVYPHLTLAFQDPDVLELLSFDPSELGPASPPPKAASAKDNLLRLKALLEGPVDAVVQNCSEVAGALRDLEGLMPVHLLVRLHVAGQLSSMRPLVEGARQRMALRGLQAPLKAEIWERCTRLNAKDALDAKIHASSNTARLDTLKQEL